MDLLETLVKGAGSGRVEQLARQFGLDADTAKKVVGQLLPALGEGVQRNIGQPGGLESLAQGLANGHHQRYLDDPAALSASREDGNAILGHVLGSKDASRNVAAHAAEQTGVDANVIKQMLPMVAALAMGALSKQTGGGRQLQGGGADLLGSLLGGAQGAGGLGDVIDLAKKLF